MPKRVIDFDAMWASDKLASCAEWAQAEYAWFYGLADASGSFELTNLRVIWGRVAAVRRNLSLERLTEIFEEFMVRGLLFTWEQNGKRYGHWTGSDVPGRLPPPSWRMRLERLAPPVPRDKLAGYLARFGAGAVASAAGIAVEGSAPPDESITHTSGQLKLKMGVDSPQAQKWDVDLEWKGSGKQPEVCAVGSRNLDTPQTIPARDEMIDEMLGIYEAERGSLPPADGSNLEARRQCLRRLSEGLTLQDFRQAVRRAAGTPFLAGAGGRGWCASFDWLVANENNLRKVLAGHYDASAQRAGPWLQDRWRTRAANAAASCEARAGTGPLASAAGARVKSATLERIRAREELRANGSEKEKAS